MEIAKQMPITTSKLRRLLNSKHPFVERNLGYVVSIIRHSMQNAAAFEAAAEHLKEGRMQTEASEEPMVFTDKNEPLPPEAPARLKSATESESRSGDISISDGMDGHPPDSVHFKESLELENDASEICGNEKETASELTVQHGSEMSQPDNKITELPRGSPFISKHIRENNLALRVSHSGAGATVQVLKKPSRAFGAILGNSTTKRKFDPDKKEKEEVKLEQIKSSVNLRFHSFVPRSEPLQPPVKEPSKISESVPHVEPSALQASSSNLEDVILLEDDANLEESLSAEAKTEPVEHTEDKTLGSALETDEDETMSLCDLSSSFQDCFKSLNQSRKPNQAEKSNKSDGFLQLKPFDYESAKKEILFGEHREEELVKEGDKGRRNKLDKVDRKKGSVVGQTHSDESTTDFQLGRRRQAFPASGNRSATFR
ncbi:hypothetical protein U1Q18_014418 [Sarracenia purpurea var. burkii]